MKAAPSTLAYPLAWPAGYPRHKSYRRRSLFASAFGASRTKLLHELSLLGARYVVISSNLATRQDGLPYADHREPTDPGIAVYFHWKGKQHCFACDRWDRVRDNLHAVNLTVAAIRGIERWGSSEILDRAFAGFQALPAAPSDWRSVLGITNGSSLQQIRLIYREKAFAAHPDRGGDANEMIRLNQALEAAERELK